jgi:cytochrome c551/c552
VKNILDGSSGTWGDMAMPASKIMGLTEKDARKLVDWILKQK